MISDYILSRYEKGIYDLQSFHNYLKNCCVIGNPDEILAAIDSKDEAEVKASLCRYLIDNEYNPRIIDYVLSVNWLTNSKEPVKSNIDLSNKPANEQEYQKQIKHYKQIVKELTGKNTYGINNNVPEIELRGFKSKKRRIFDTYYERIIEERYFPDRPIRYSVIEYLCSFPKINPVYMARRLANSGYEIAFDDTSISQSENNKKRREVFDFEYRKRVGLGSAIPMFLEEPSSEQEPEIDM